MCKRWALLLCCFIANSLSVRAVYTLKLGEPLVLTVDCPVSTGWLTSTSWSCPQYVQTEPNGVGVCTVYPFSYYSGTVTVTCDYWYSYPIEYNGRIRYQNGSGTKYFSIKIVKPTFTIDKTELTVQPGERFVLSTSMSNVYTAKYTSVWWTTSDNNVVEKSYSGGNQSYNYQNYEFTAVSPGVATITATIGTGTEVTCRVTVAKQAPTSVTLPASKTIKIGETATLTPTLSPSGVSTTYTWSSNNTSVATVNQSGTVTGKSDGTARITVTTANGLTDYCDVTVYKPVPTNVNISQSTLTLPVGSTQKLSYTVTPSDAFYTATWTSDATEVVTVSSSGMVTALASGTAQVSVTTDNGLTACCIVTVPPLPSTVSIPSSLLLGLHESCQLKLTMSPSNASAPVSWTSSDNAVVTVSQTGIVTARDVGQVTVTAITVNGLKATCQITVPEPKYKMVVWTKDGSMTKYDFADRPCLTIADDFFVMKTDYISIRYRATDFLKFTLVDSSVEALPGDVDGNGVIDIADVAYMIGYLNRQIPDNFVVAAADMNGDGNVDSHDLVIIVNLIINK